MIHIVTKGRLAEKAFSGLETRRWKPEEMDAAISECGPLDILYLDAAAFAKSAFAAALSSLSGNGRVAWGVVDLKDGIADTAPIFRSGASDFLGSFALEAPADPARAEAAIRFGTRSTCGDPRAATPAAPERKFPGWNAVKEGKEYDLLFLYVGLADPESIRRKTGESRFNRLKEDFLSMLAPSVNEAGGRIWMGDGQSALCVFPPASGASVVAFCLRLLINRAIVAYEQLKLEIPVDFRLALHRGSTVWKEPGNTGTLVAEAVNFIYHMGRKFSRAGTLAVSEDARECIPGRLMREFDDEGLFECKKTLVFPGFDSREGAGHATIRDDARNRRPPGKNR